MKLKKKKILKYNAVFQEEGSGGYSVWVPSLPGCCSQGDSFDEAIHNIKEAIDLYLNDDGDFVIDDDSQGKQYLVPITLQYA